MVKREKGWKQSKPPLKLSRELPNTSGGEIADVALDDLTKKIPAIIKYVDGWLSEKLGKQLRAAAQRVKPYLDYEHAAALRAGFTLGQEWQKWDLWVNSPPILKALEGKGGSDRGAEAGQTKGHKTKQLRIDWLKNAAKEKFRKKPAPASKTVARDIEREIVQIQREEFDLDDERTNEAVKKWKIGSSAIYKLVLEARDNL